MILPGLEHYASEDAFQGASATFLIGPLVNLGKKGWGRIREQGVLHPQVQAFHTPNGGQRSAKTAMDMLRMGVMRGVPDWTLVWRGRVRLNEIGAQLAYIELKHGKGRLSEEQRTYQDFCSLAGIPFGVATDSLDQIFDFLVEWTVPLSAYGEQWRSGQ